MIDSSTMGLNSLGLWAPSHFARAMTKPSRSWAGQVVSPFSMAVSRAKSFNVWTFGRYNRSNLAHPSAPRAAWGLNLWTECVQSSTVSGGSVNEILGIKAWTNPLILLHVCSVNCSVRCQRGFQKEMRLSWTSVIFWVCWWKSKDSPTSKCGGASRTRSSSTMPFTARGFPWWYHCPSLSSGALLSSRTPCVPGRMALTSKLVVSQKESTWSGLAFLKSWNMAFMVLSYLDWRISWRWVKCHLSNCRNEWWKAW